MRHIIKVPYSDSNESIDRLPMYEIVSVALKKILNLIFIKIKNEKFSVSQTSDQQNQSNALSNEDKVLIYEVAATCALLCSQCSLFQMSKMEVRQAGQHSRTRRTPQEKCLDFMISQLFPPQNIMTLIDIIFRDMSISYKVFEQSSVLVIGEEQEPFEIKVKQNLMREYIRIFLGEYLSKCKDNKYDILESIMKGVVYDKKRLRESYLQEILHAMGEASYRDALENYIYEKKFSFEAEEREKINHLQWVELIVDQQSQYK